MKILSAEYIKSFTNVQEINLPPKPTFAFVGRSNVGKSSVMNRLIERKNLVKTSSTPGKTQLINYFLVNNNFYLADLPGYGFAKVPVGIKKNWKFMIQEFLFQCPNLNVIFQLVDIRHSPTKDDIEFNNTLLQCSASIAVIANKVDKLQKNAIPKQLKVLHDTLQASVILPFSVLNKTGLKELQSIVSRHIR